jgi:hypothetical protein
MDDTFRFLFPVWYDGGLSFSDPVSVLTRILSPFLLNASLRGVWSSSSMALFVVEFVVVLLLLSLVELLLSIKGWEHRSYSSSLRFSFCFSFISLISSLLTAQVSDIRLWFPFYPAIAAPSCYSVALITHFFAFLVRVRLPVSIIGFGVFEFIFHLMISLCSVLGFPCFIWTLSSLIRRFPLSISILFSFALVLE